MREGCVQLALTRDCSEIPEWPKGISQPSTLQPQVAWLWDDGPQVTPGIR